MSANSSKARPYSGFVLTHEYAPGYPKSAFQWHLDIQNHHNFKAERLHLPHRSVKQPVPHDTGCLVKKSGLKQIACHAIASELPAQPFVFHTAHNEPNAIPACNDTEDHQEISVQEIITDLVPEQVCQISSQSHQHFHLAMLTAC